MLALSEHALNMAPHALVRVGADDSAIMRKLKTALIGEKVENESVCPQSTLITHADATIPGAFNCADWFTKEINGSVMLPIRVNLLGGEVAAELPTPPTICVQIFAKNNNNLRTRV